ncbi:serine O-acetyltransferase [Shewanella sp. HL-SH4]|uniref:serine O-acetyltransferase n=1 Tax=Shewanella sp. HL-SH4 TaxID=3436240 RepID=UPI003EBD358C
MNAITIHRFSSWLYTKNIPVLPRILYYFIFLIYNSSIPPSVKIGKNSKLGYGGIGVVLHARAVIGKNVVISQNVTIGGKSGLFEVPVIEDDVYIGAGAVILGPITIKTGAIVGANAVVDKNVEPYTVVGGVPAKFIKNVDKEVLS